VILGVADLLHYNCFNFWIGYTMRMVVLMARGMLRQNERELADGSLLTTRLIMHSYYRVHAEDGSTDRTSNGGQN